MFFFNLIILKCVNNLLLFIYIKIKNKLYVIHIAEKDLQKNTGLKIAKPGIENTIILH